MGLRRRRRGRRPCARARGTRLGHGPLAGRPAARRRGAPLGSRTGRGGGGMTFEEARAQYPVLERLAYLQAGSAGPVSRPAADAVIEQQRLELEGGRGGMPYL